MAGAARANEVLGEVRNLLAVTMLHVDPNSRGATLAQASSGDMITPAARLAAHPSSSKECAMTPPARLRTVVLDCPEPLALAEFYRSLIGGELSYDGDEPDWVDFEPEPGRRFAFQQADDYAPPTWPTGERPQQLHIDLTVDDIEVAEPAVLALGARRHDVQPGEDEGDTFRVYLDPAGHPFCLCWD